MSLPVVVRPRRPRSGARDEGSTLILALVMVLVGSLIVVPLLTYTLAVTHANRGLQNKASATEAVKGGLRAALQDPAALYAACVNSGRTVPVSLAVPPGLGIVSSCTTTQDALQEVPSNLRWAVTTTQAGSNTLIPAAYVNTNPATPELDGTINPLWCTSLSASPPLPCGKPYPNNGNANTGAWTSDVTTASTGSKIFLPQLPPISNVLAYNGGYALPAGDTGPSGCRVYFPGRYLDDVVITGTTPAYFVSGIYYFEKTLRISGDANVVVGAGVTQACADSDAIAVADAIGAPLDAYSNGVGGTFVFGAAGRLVVDTATAGGAAGASLVFNRRLMPGSDPLSSLNDISIMSVNGVWNGSSTSTLDIPNQLHVPVSPVAATTPTDPWLSLYKSSTLVSTVAPPASCAPPPAVVALTCPIIDLNFTTSGKINLKVPGYVDVPQGMISIQTATAAAAANKTIAFGGGVLAAQMNVSAVTPASLQLGLLNPVVQKTFKITSRTTTTPGVVSTALVQVNETGGYAINSWIVTTG
jgi:hypothetical protein